MEHKSGFDKFEFTLNCNNTTNPSQLQEVTLDVDATNFSYFGMRSPGAPTNNCRSVKEIDEQLTNLRKENFNLKLRIYFLEERMGGNFNADKEDAMQNNIELMVELENVRKELEEKHELLCQAAKALEIEEEERKRESTEKDKKITSLNIELQDIKNQLQTQTQLQEEKEELALCAQAFNLDLSGYKKSDSFKSLQDMVGDLQQQLSKERDYIKKIEHIAVASDITQQHSKRLEAEIDEKQTRIEKLCSELEDSDQNITILSQKIETLEDDLRQKTSQLQNSLAELRLNDKTIKDQQEILNEFTGKLGVLEEQRDIYEKKMEKYKSLLVQSENKNRDLVLHIETLKEKLQILETEIDEIKCSKQIILNSSVQNGEELMSISKTPPIFVSIKMPSKVVTGGSSRNDNSAIYKTQQYNSSNSIPSPVKSHTLSAKSGVFLEAGENVSLNKKLMNVPVSSEEITELKKNHYKACKMLKAMLQKKLEYVEQIEKLQIEVSQKGIEVQVLKDRLLELGENRIKVDSKKKSLQELVSEMNLTACSNPAAINKEATMEEGDLDLVEQYKELVKELETKIEVLNATLNEKDIQMNRLMDELNVKANKLIDLEFELLTINEDVLKAENDEQVEKLLQDQEQKENEIKRLDTELRKRTCDLQGIVNKELWEKNRSIEKLQTILKLRDHKIQQLEKDAHSKTLQLKLLKDKINELGIHINLPPGLFTFDVSTCQDSSDINGQQHKIYLEERKELLSEIEQLKAKLTNTPERDDHLMRTSVDNGELIKIHKEFIELQDELEKSQKIRAESQEICLILSTRLEELSRFLESLLKNKLVLGFLGTSQSHKLKNIIDKNLDLSRNLSSTLSLQPDQSLLQLSNITSLLNSTQNDSFDFNFDDLMDAKDDDNNTILSIIPSNITLTYQTHLNRTTDQDHIISILRQQIVDLKHEIELRDVELGKSVDNQAIAVEKKLKPAFSAIKAEKNINENHSESESWSEPDRIVSLARIGLQDDSLRRPSTSSCKRRLLDSNVSSESTDEQEFNRTPSKKAVLAESRQTVIVLHEQIQELEKKVKNKEKLLVEAQQTLHHMEASVKGEQAKVEEALQTNIQLTMQVVEINNKLAEVEEQKLEMGRKVIAVKEEYDRQIEHLQKVLKETIESKCSAEKKVEELQLLVKALEEFKQNMQNTLNSKDKNIQNLLNEIEVEKQKALTAAETGQKLLNKANLELRIIESQLEHVCLREEQARLKIEDEYKLKLSLVEEEYSKKINALATNHEMQLNQYNERLDHIRTCYENDYVQKIEVEDKLTEIERITKELENLKSVMENYEIKLQDMEIKELELKTQVQNMQTEHHNKIMELQQELDHSTLQYSEVILEKSRLQNEKTLLEQQMQKFYSKESELIIEVNNLHKEFQQTHTNLNEKINCVEVQKLKLESNILQLEGLNAELSQTNYELNGELTKIKLGFFESQPSTSNATCQTLKDSSIQTIQAVQAIQAIQTIQSFYTQPLYDYSGYNSEDIPNKIEEDHIRNTSPDLGIESDQGRLSSLEANISRPLLPTLELAESMSTLLDSVEDATNCTNDNCCNKTKQMASENLELRRRLLRTRRALEETLNRLTLANKQKREVEKSICKQISKTSQVLRKAKANLDSGSDTDICIISKKT